MKQNRKNPWEILKLKPNASLQEIKTAYHTMAKKHHPDSGGTITEWLLISNAYNDIIHKKRIPVINATDTKMINLSLSIEQQVNGFKDIISIDIGGEEVYINVNIPAGALKDDKFYVKDKNQKYIINIKQSFHPEYLRQGMDLVTYKKLDFISVLKRRPFIILTPLGEYVEVSIPDNIITDTNTIIVPDQGLYNRKTKKRGKLRIKVDTDIPTINEVNLESFITRLRND